MVAPALVVYIGFLVFPVALGLYYALTNSDGISQADFIGLDNFRELAGDDNFRSAVWHTVQFAAIIVVAQNVGGLGIALLLNRAGRLYEVARAVIFAPVLLSTTVVALIWGFIYSPLAGVLPQLFAIVGLEVTSLDDVLGATSTVIPGISAAVTWQFLGYVMVIYLAGLKTIPTELYEAAALDGAVGFARLRYVTLPLLRPTASVALTIALIGNLRLFDQVWLMSEGGPAGASETVQTAIYRSAFQQSRFGYAAAQAVIVTVGIFAVILTQRALFARAERGAR